MAISLENKYRNREEYEDIVLCYGKSFIEKLFNYENNHPNGIDCKKCLLVKTTFQGYKKGYKEYCSKCGHSAPGVNERRKNTCLEKYGSDNVFKTGFMQEKSKETCLKKYGVTNANKTKETREKIRKTIKEKIGVDSYFKIPEFKRKVLDIIKEKHGAEYSMQTEKGKEKFLETCIERYGMSYVASEQNRDKLREKEVQDKANIGRENTCQEKYGVDHISQIPEVRKKVKTTLIEKYGVDCNMNIPFIVEKTKLKIKEKYGVEWGCLIKTNYKTSKYERALREYFQLDPFKLGTKQFDLCFIEDKILVEIDGEFWHKEDIRKINNQQFTNFINDYKKEILAKENGYNLKRIRVNDLSKIIKSKIITKEIIFNNCYIKEYNFNIPLNEIILKEYLEMLILSNNKQRLKLLFKNMKEYIFISTGKQKTINEILKENYELYNTTNN